MTKIIKDYPIIYSYGKNNKIYHWKLQVIEIGNSMPCMKGIYIEYYYSSNRKGNNSIEIFNAKNGRTLIEQAIYEADKMYENKLKKIKNILTDSEVLENYYLGNFHKKN